MAVYAFMCPVHGEFEHHGSMKAPPTLAPCPGCSHVGVRVYTVPQFSEDRTRLWRSSVDGSRFSYSLGRPMPESRRECEAAYAAIGAEPVSRKTMPEAWKRDQEYLQHVRGGGERETPAPQTKPVGITVKEQMRKSGVRVG